MFTGIIEEKGIVEKFSLNGLSGTLCIRCRIIYKELKEGDSVAVNGICLTAKKIIKDCIYFDVMSATIKSSALRFIKKNNFVNLERAMKADGRFGGHIVTGHVDGTGRIEKIIQDENAVWYFIVTDINILHSLVIKGSIALDGISLTVQYLDENKFGVSIIPHTLSETIIGTLTEGDCVNIETDILGKYITVQNNYKDEQNKINQKERDKKILDFLNGGID